MMLSLTHNMAAPLQTISSGVNQIFEAYKTENNMGMKNLQTILNSSLTCMHALVNDFIDFESIGKGRFSLAIQKFKLKAAFMEIIESYKIQAEKSKKSLCVQFDDFLPSIVITDKMRLQQVLRNLLSNAINYAS